MALTQGTLCSGVELLLRLMVGAVNCNTRSVERKRERERNHWLEKKNTHLPFVFSYSVWFLPYLTLCPLFIFSVGFSKCSFNIFHFCALSPFIYALPFLLSACFFFYLFIHFLLQLLPCCFLFLLHSCLFIVLLPPLALSLHFMPSFFFHHRWEQGT